MLACTTYSEAGGVGKTTISANVGVALARRGHNVLLIDLDPQDGCLSHLLDVDEDRASETADNLVLHMVGKPRGDVRELIKTTTEGVDVIPSHNMLSRLGDLLDTAADYEEQTSADPDFEFQRHAQLRRVLLESGIHTEYDAIMIDPPATEGPQLYNALYATGSVLIPVELTGKGEQSVLGLESLASGFESQLDTEIGVLATVPNRFEGTSDQQAYLDEVKSHGYSAPVTIRKRGSMLEGCWKRNCSAFKFVEEYRDYQRDYEVETLEQFGALAAHLAQRTGLEPETQEVEA